MLTINLETIPAVLIASAITAVCVIGYNSLKAVQELIFVIGNVKEPTPQSVLGRLLSLERELKGLRDWAIRRGYDRREHGIATEEENSIS